MPDDDFYAHRADVRYRRADSPQSRLVLSRLCAGLRLLEPDGDVPLEQPDVDVRAERDRPQPAGERDEPAVAEHAAAVLDEPAAAARQARSDSTGTNVNYPAIEPDGTSTSNPSLFPSTIYTDTFDNFYVGVLDWIITPKLYANVAVGAFDYGTQRLTAPARSCAMSSARRTSSTPRFRRALQNVNAYADFPSSSVTVYDDFLRNTITSDLTYYADKWGQHTIKGGFQYERISNSRLGGAQYPTITLNWGQVRAALDGRRVSGTYGHYTVTRVYNSGDIHTNGVGLFLQDSWTLGRNVTLNLGVRTDKEEIPSYTPGNRGIKFDFADKISPRAGFAWDIFGNSKWKGYGSFGIFYDTSKLEMPRGLFGSEHSVTYYYTLDTFNWPSIQCGHPPSGGPSCPGTFIEEVDFRHAANEEDNFLIDPNLKPIRTREFTLGLDHELSQTHLAGRPLRAQALRPHHRGHRRAGARHRRGLPHHQSRREHRRERPARLRRLHHLPEPAEADAELRRRRIPDAQAAVEQLVAHRELSLQPHLWQLLGPDQLRREQPQLAERQPLLRRPVQLVRSPAAIRSLATSRPTVRISSRCRAPTICRGEPASASTGSARAARRNRPR